MRRPRKGEATLPVKFATSLLKDKNGLIKLDIPVSGTLDDPKLRIGPIVWQIFKNLIVKAVTAPFKLFGAMFKGAEDAQFVDFAPGSPADRCRWHRTPAGAEPRALPSVRAYRWTCPSGPAPSWTGRCWQSSTMKSNWLRPHVPRLARARERARTAADAPGAGAGNAGAEEAD